MNEQQQPQLIIQNKIVECPNCKRAMEVSYTDLDAGMKQLTCPFCNKIFIDYLPKSYMPK